METSKQIPPPSAPVRSGRHVAILGAGVAGLAAGYFISKSGGAFTTYEAQPEVGGLCRTFRHGDFFFDSGAHRFHDQDVTASAELGQLLPDCLERHSLPSQIFSQGRWIDFPLSPLDLLLRLGPLAFARIAGEILKSRLLPAPERNDSLESFAVRAYGPTLASLFLLNYSQKLWGVPCRELFNEASKKRLRGLTLRTFVLEWLRGKQAKTKHLDGSFLYPHPGIGAIGDRLLAASGRENVITGSRVTRVQHRQGRIRSIQLNDEEWIEVEHVISTLPLPHFVRLLQPPPPVEVLEALDDLRFRQVVLVALFLDKAAVGNCATVYFPDAAFPFTRVSEPKNRSAAMAPPGKTSLLAEIPCFASDEAWTRPDSEWIATVTNTLAGIGWLRPEEVLAAQVRRLSDAYPVLSLAGVRQRGLVLSYLGGFANFNCLGRGAQFSYLHIHDLIAGAAALAKKIDA